LTILKGRANELCSARYTASGTASAGEHLTTIGHASYGSTLAMVVYHSF
jgi:hypothetical protein